MIEASQDTLKDIHAYCERHNLVGSLANIAALLKNSITEVNWLGFYLFDGQILRLGPFQGNPACTEIVLGRGVCGTAAAENRTILVEDVDQFPGHIVCDSASRSEIVVPLFQNGKLVGVLDVDSPLLARFTDSERVFFEEAAKLILSNLDFSQVNQIAKQ
jgi:L-methionine (R)-S-oxide reductase